MNYFIEVHRIKLDYSSNKNMGEFVYCGKYLIDTRRIAYVQESLSWDFNAINRKDSDLYERVLFLNPDRKFTHIYVDGREELEEFIVIESYDTIKKITQ